MVGLDKHLKNMVAVLLAPSGWNQALLLVDGRNL